MSQVTAKPPRREDAEPETSTGGTDEQSPASRLPRDEIFEILRASRRREVLLYLDAHGGEATIGTLAEHVAARENDVDRSDLTTSQRKRVYVGLYQMHLPKMDGIGVIEWDKDRGTVRLLDASRWPLAYLHFDPEADRAEAAPGPIDAFRRWIRRVVAR